MHQPLVGVERSLRFLSVSRFEHPVHLHSEKAPGDGAHRLVILHQKDRSIAPR